MVQNASFWLFVALGAAALAFVPARLRPGLLAVASFACLVATDAFSVLALTAWSVAFYRLAPLGTRRRWAVPALVVSILAFLAWFKYVPPLLDGASAYVVPLGISYFTFKLIHYAVEVGRGNIAPHSYADFLCYLLLLPIYTAGPIERCDHFLAKRDERWTSEATVAGLTRIAHGLVKRFVIVEIAVPRLYGHVQVEDVKRGIVENLSVPTTWRFVAVAFLAAYLEFSAYSDIAIGASRVMGVGIMENFDWPILARSVGSFWKRWHMTLAGWCQSYVYMPVLGLTRRPYVAVFFTFLAIGLWHGAAWNWVAWGMWHAMGVSVHLTWSKWKRTHRFATPKSALWEGACWLATFAFVSVGQAFSVTEGAGGVRASIAILSRLVGL